MSPTVVAAVTAMLVSLPTAGWADPAGPSAPAPTAPSTAPDYFGRARNQIVVQAPAQRSPAQRWLLRGLVGGGVVLAGVGAYFNLDSRAAAADVSADTPTNLPWGPSQVELVDRAERSGHLAIAGYATGAAALVAAAVIAWRTDPGPGRAVVVGAVRPRADLVPGGATVGVTCGF
ncbi:MAG: hypothetical protein KBG28_13485 [Kofleriaceae bacterium]|jgi:hypothetical protein|nr:hypothetical protein [Kofleriaceae bacterium]MBP6835693.1 hypothetical protein [Kofleriaceae bacterium]MBP9204978.1 hypothetical protein [Kofleriaceae bacterium]